MANIVKPTGMSLIWSATGTKTAPTDLKIAQGWVVELPPYQTANFIENKQDQFNAHVNMHGIPAWDTETEYQGGISYAKGSNGTIYKCLQTHTNLDPINPLNSAYWSIAFEAYGSVAALQAVVNTHITNYGTLAALTNVAAARTNLSVYSKIEADNKYALMTGNASNTFSVATATDAAHAVPLGQISSLLSAATTTTAGVARFATSAEVEGAALSNVIVAPTTGAAVYLKKTGNLAGLANVSQARANLGITDTAIQPLGTYVTNASVVGQTATFAGLTAPAGWLVCDGSAVSRTTYANLFAYIGTLYGAGNGTTTFNLPDCRDEFMRGWTGSAGSIGTKFSDSIKSHTHSASSSAEGGHAHTGSTSADGSHTHAAGTGNAGSHTHGVSVTAYKYGGSIDEGRISSNDTAGAANAATGVVLDSAGDHVHAVTVSSNGSHSHSLSINAVVDHSHAITIGSTGVTETKPRGIYQLVCIRY